MSRATERVGTKSEWRRGSRKQGAPYGIQAVRNFKAFSKAPKIKHV